jgi:hypothetical protein
MTETGSGWSVMMLVFQVLLTIVGGIGVLLLKKVLNGFGERLTTLENRGHKGAISSIVADGQIKEHLARDYVRREECRANHAEGRETQTRLFGKIEELQRGQAKIEGELRALAGFVRNGGRHGKG